MGRLQARFEELQEKNEKALIPYIVAGDPNLSETVGFMHGMVESGADIIELGVPFSDPMADGPANQLGHERALKNGTSTKDVLGVVREFREKDANTPVLLMGYLNPIESYGYEAYAEDASTAGVDALLVVDLPPEEANALKVELDKKSIDLIFLVAPTTKEERVKKITSAGSGFLYYVSLKGVTGAGHLDIDSVKEKLSVIRSYSNIPVAVGFGIKDAESAKQIAKLADGVVVGSVLVDICGQASGDIKNDLCVKISELKKAISE